MLRLIRRIRKPTVRQPTRDVNRKRLEGKVDAGTKRAVKQYRKTFELLERYDRE